jgi:nitroreductase
MDLLPDRAAADFAHAVIHSRRNVLPRHLVEPGPTPAQLQEILGAAAAAPDHRQLLPWRFVIVPAAQRARLGGAFALALAERDASATPEQLEQAREKAHRAPVLLLAIARLAGVTLLPQGTPPRPRDAEVGDAERLVSLGCAIQNIMLCAHAAGFGTGLTSGQALGSTPLRALFGLKADEIAVCCINIGSVRKKPTQRLRPALGDYLSELS